MILRNILKSFSQDLAIDLGTANVLVYVKGEGIVVNEPSVVAINKETGRIVAIGKRAKEMVGRTPASIVAVKPLTSGVVADFEVTEQMLKYFIDRVRSGLAVSFIKPRVVVGIPSGVTEVEKRAVENAAINAGASKAYLVEEPIAAAIGARLPVNEATGSMIVEIGGGTTEIAIISLGGIVVHRSIRVAGNVFNQDIIDYMKEKYNLIIGEQTAENIKISLGCAFPLDESLTDVARGRDVITGLPKELEITNKDILKALEKSLSSIISSIKEVIEDSPPELLIDVYRHGMVLSGGGSLLRNLDKLIYKETNVPAIVAEDPLTTVVRGAGIILEEIDVLGNILAKSDYKKPPK